MTPDEIITEEDRNERLLPITQPDIAVLLDGFNAYWHYLSKFLNHESDSIPEELERIKPWIRSLDRKKKEGGNSAWAVRGYELCLFKSMAELVLQKYQADRQQLLASGVPEEATEGLDRKIERAHAFVERGVFKKVQTAKVIGKNHFQVEIPQQRQGVSIQNKDGVVIFGDHNELKRG